eukprot:m.28677 g.28677  ORF g.28677 m.28677 type:complete len:520 (-) comp13623_c0_seq6:181-1740(-)
MAVSGTLIVNIVKANDLQPCDKNGLSDPYVKLEAAPEVHEEHGRRRSSLALGDFFRSKPQKKHSLRTTVMRKTLNPVWHENIEMELHDAEVIRIFVMDWDRMGGHDQCGVAELILQDLHLLNHVPKPLTVNLQPQGTLELTVELIDHTSLFGLDITSVVQREGMKVPNIMTQCFRYVEAHGLSEPGIYRKCGSLTSVLELKSKFIDDERYELPEGIPIDVVASLLKLYLREMPEPLFTNELHADIVAGARKIKSSDCADIIHALARLPQAHQDAVVALFAHLQKIRLQSDKNKMTAQNLATCFGPSIVSPSDQSNITEIGGDNIVVAALLENPFILEIAFGPDEEKEITKPRERARAKIGRVSNASLNHQGPFHSVFCKHTFSAARSMNFVAFAEACYDLGGLATHDDFDRADVAGKGNLSFDEFDAWARGSRLGRYATISPERQKAIQQMANYFRFFDKDGNGTVDAKEYPALHADLVTHEYALPADPDECLRVLDKNGDGEVSIEEFASWLLENDFI